MYYINDQQQLQNQGSKILTYWFEEKVRINNCCLL